jgi:hypothetical protein
MHPIGAFGLIIWKNNDSRFRPMVASGSKLAGLPLQYAARKATLAADKDQSHRGLKADEQR